MKLALALVCVAACSTQDNLGNHVFGEARWSLSLGSPGVERATAVTVDPIGNVIVAGTCGGAIDFGSGPIDCYGSFISQRSSETGAERWTTRLPDARVSQLVLVGNDVHVIGTRPVLDGLVEQFIAVIDAGGELRASTELGLAGIVTAPVAAFDAEGRVFTTGGVGSMPESDAQATRDTLDLFVSAHHPDGTHAWTTVMPGDDRQVGTAIAVSPNGDLVLVVEASGPFAIDGELIDHDHWPVQLVVRITQSGDLVWAQEMPDVVQRLALTPIDAVVLGGCPSTGVLDPTGDERWRVGCKDPVATVDAVAVSAEGEIVLGGHHANAAGEDGELFLVAFDGNGNLISSARSVEFPEPSDSRIDAIAVEPTGEVVFVTTATHAFDFGNGLLPYAGQEDVIVAKLDSSTGRDGQVLLARTVP